MSSQLEVNRIGNRSGWSHHKIENELKRFKQERGIERDLKEREVVEFLFGGYDCRASTRLDIFIREYPETTMKHRLNRLWAYPFTFALAPFRYVLYGDIGWSENTKLGGFILDKCGYK